MAVNTLARQFKIPFSDYYSIDISPDVHVFRVMRRTGLVSSTADRESIIYKARELNHQIPRHHRFLLLENWTELLPSPESKVRELPDQIRVQENWAL
jgi:hypothetical protein